METFAGQGGVGSIYAPAVSVKVNVDTHRRLVRNADGAEEISEMTLTVHPSDEAMFTLKSRLTFRGRKSTVLEVKPQTFRGKTVLVEVACS